MLLLGGTGVAVHIGSRAGHQHSNSGAGSQRRGEALTCMMSVLWLKIFT